MTGPVMAATRWPTNADLIADVARLGYLCPSDVVLDPTYGRGIWWKKWRPTELIAHDLRLDGVDFRRLPEASGSVDAAAYDPPYVCVGGRATSTLAAKGSDMHARYGMDTAPRTPAALQDMNDAGLAELVRVVKPKGIVLVKCQDYVWSRRLYLGTFHTLSAALALGMELVDRLEHITNPRPQPERTRADGRPSVQQHARRNLSTLFVLRAPACVDAGPDPQLTIDEHLAETGIEPTIRSGAPT